ncbi:unnamed protein product [Clavelina lepadiformis]|uniref:Gypsy retrotransposon integrase-like protein 1 n=1 Tax=Clavelina lepadiformis TaxID=159417 RepID=A0ABP0GLL5_CLALP
MSLSIGEIEVPLRTQPIIPERNEIFITESVVVPASSEIRVMAKLTNLAGGDNFSSSPVYVERNVEFNAKYGILTANCIATPVDARIPVWLANFSDDDVEIHNGTRVATVFPISVTGNVPCELPGTCALVGKPVRRDCGCVGHGCINASESVNVIEKATCSTPDRWNKIKENIRIDEGLSDEQRQAVLAILRKHQDTGGASPSRQAPRRMGPQQKRKVEEIINDMQEGDLIRPSKSPWSSSIVLVKKKSDHSSLRWLWRSKEMYGQCARWVEHLSAYEFELVHRVGNKHQNADALSRVELEETPADFPYVVQDPGKNITTVTNVLHTIELREALGYSVGEIKAAQEADEDISPLFRWLEKGVRPNYRSVKKLSAVLRHYWSVFGKLSQRNGILYYRDENCTQPGESVYRLILPAKLRLKVLRNLHDERVGGGHLGIAKTSSKIRNRFYWARWRREVEDYCRRCLGCEFNKKPSKSSRAELIPSNECRPLERIEVDVLGPLPMSHTGFQYILVACDVYTKYVRAWPMRHQSAKETAGLLFHRWFMVHGVPETVHSDQGRNFESTLFKELLALMGANKTRSSPYHPSGNGGVERNNRTIVAMLRNYVQKDERNWDQVLSAVVAAYNASAHDSTGLSPHYLLTGRMLRLPADLQGKNVATELSLETEMDALRDRLLLADQVTDEVLGEQRAKMKTHHDKQCHGKEISVGDRVLLDNPAVPVDRCRKFHLPYKGPYKVAKKVGQVNYQVEDDHGKKQTVHYNRLKRVSKDVNRLEESVESQEGNNAPIRESQAR